MLHRDLARQVSENGTSDSGSRDATGGLGFWFISDMQSPVKLNLYHAGA